METLAPRGILGVVRKMAFTNACLSAQQDESTPPIRGVGNDLSQPGALRVSTDQRANSLVGPFDEWDHSAHTQTREIRRNAAQVRSNLAE